MRVEKYDQHPPGREEQTWDCSGNPRSNGENYNQTEKTTRHRLLLLPCVLFNKSFQEFSYRAVAPWNLFGDLILSTLIYVSFASSDIQ